ncbi:hypothetical protein NDU88_006563, partial [Pleurodeles waltl]
VESRLLCRQGEAEAENNRAGGAAPIGGGGGIPGSSSILSIPARSSIPAAPRSAASVADMMEEIDRFQVPTVHAEMQP